MRKGALAGLLACLLPCLAACSPRVGPGVAFDGAGAYRDVQAQTALGPRVPGLEASRRAREYIRSELLGAGWVVGAERWVYDGVELENLVARRGQGPAVLLGAHYDSRARADLDASDATAAVPGANDGASGVAVLLELARTLDPERLRDEVWLAFFDGEDQGGLGGWPWSVGARHMAEHLAIKPQFAVVVDMVGDAHQEIYWEAQSTPWLNERIWSLAEQLGYGGRFVAQTKYSIIDDHIPFLEHGIPAIDIIDFDYPYWHTQEDTADKVSAASLEGVGQVLKRLLESPGGTDLP